MITNVEWMIGRQKGIVDTSKCMLYIVSTCKIVNRWSCLYTEITLKKLGRTATGVRKAYVQLPIFQLCNSTTFDITERAPFYRVIKGSIEKHLIWLATVDTNIEQEWVTIFLAQMES